MVKLTGTIKVSLSCQNYLLTNSVKIQSICAKKLPYSLLPCSLTVKRQEWNGPAQFWGELIDASLFYKGDLGSEGWLISVITFEKWY